MAVDVLKQMHSAADRMGRLTGQYVPEIRTIEAGIKAICELRRENAALKTKLNDGGK